MIVSCDLIIIGGEGDLAFRKLYPALYNLECEGLLGDDIRVFAFGRGKFDGDALIGSILEWIERSEYVPEVDPVAWGRFKNRIVHSVGDATNESGFAGLAPHGSNCVLIAGVRLPYLRAST